MHKVLFFHAGLQKANSDYSAKLASNTASDKTLFTLGWKLDELARLSEAGRDIKVKILQLIESLSDEKCDVVAANVASRLGNLRKSATCFLKGK